MTTRTPKTAPIGKTCPLEARTRFAMFFDTTMSAQEACSLDESEINFDLLMRTGVRAANLRVAGMGPARLKAHGVDTARQLRQLGFDAFDLCNAKFCEELILSYGAEEARAAFLTTPMDAVCIAGSEAQHLLSISPTQLLETCCGFPCEAINVLKQLPPGLGLRDVPCQTILDAGLRASTLAELGYGMALIVAQNSPSRAELATFGFVV